MTFEMRLESQFAQQTIQSHVISVLNFKRWMSVKYPIVILKGSVRHTFCVQQQQVANVLCVDGVECKLGARDRFKALVRLRRGCNAIKLEYCCVRQTFELIYEFISEPIRFVRPLYVIFRKHDGAFQAPSNTMDNSKEQALARIDLNCQLLQSILGEKLHERNMQHHSFQLRAAQVFYSSIDIEESRTLDAHTLFHKLALEIEKSPIASGKIKHLAFLAGTQYRGELYEDGMGHDDLTHITFRYIALGCGALALFHTACLFAWPAQLQDVIGAFENDTKIDRRQLLSDSNSRDTWGACYSTTLGAVLHELCHTFDLGHADHGIMSRQFDNVRDVFLVEDEHAIDADQRTGMRGITDTTKIHPSGAVILRYHKWFQCEHLDLPYMLTFEMEQRLIRSTYGVRVIEIRAGDSEMVTQFWIYNTPRMHLQMKFAELAERSVLFVEDMKGNSIKVALNFNV